MSERWQHLRQTLRTPVLFSSSYWGPGLTSHAGPCPALPLALTCGWSLGGAAGGQQAQILLPLPGLHSQPYPFQEASAPSSCGHHVSWGQLPNFSSWGGLDLLDGRSCLDLSRTCAPPPQCASPSVCRTDAHTYLAGLLQGPRQRWLSLTEVFMSGSFVPFGLNQPPLQPPPGWGRGTPASISAPGSSFCRGSLHGRLQTGSCLWDPQDLPEPSRTLGLCHHHHSFLPGQSQVTHSPPGIPLARDPVLRLPCHVELGSSENPSMLFQKGWGRARKYPLTQDPLSV